MKTFDTACCYYHKFRLCYRETEYNYYEVAIAALFVACKTEDTPKKSRDILCAAYNLKGSDQKTPDDKSFDQTSKIVIALERMILELVSFDMSGRYPQYMLPKVIRTLIADRATGHEIYAIAYDMSIDMYKTYAPLKQTTFTMAVALVELACRLMDRHSNVVARINPRRWHTSRACVLETLLDLLDLYNQNSKSTIIGIEHPEITYSRFLSVKIDLNQEVESSLSLERYSVWCDQCKRDPIPKGTSSGLSSATPNIFGVPIIFKTGTAFSPTDFATTTPGMPGASPTSTNELRRQTSSGQLPRPVSSGPARYVFDREEARREGERVNEFFEDRYEEHEYEVDEPIPEQSPPSKALLEVRRGAPPRGPLAEGWARRPSGGGLFSGRRGPSGRTVH